MLKAALTQPLRIVAQITPKPHEHNAARGSEEEIFELLAIRIL